MKYLKLFEDEKTERESYKVRTDEPYFTLSMKKLKILNGFSWSNINELKEEIKHSDSNSKYLLFLVNKKFRNKSFSKNDDDFWNYTKYNKSEVEKFEMCGFVYKGEVQIEPWEIAAYKYNL